MTDRDETLNVLTLPLAAQDLPVALDMWLDAGVDLANRCDGANQAFMASMLRHLVRRVAAELDHERARAHEGKDAMAKQPPATGAGATGAPSAAVPPVASATQNFTGEASAGTPLPVPVPVPPAATEGSE